MKKDSEQKELLDTNIIIEEYRNGYIQYKFNFEEVELSGHEDLKEDSCPFILNILLIGLICNFFIKNVHIIPKED